MTETQLRFLRAIAEPGPLADTIGYAPDVSFEDKVKSLETLDVADRLELAVRLQRDRLTELQLRKKIRDDVQSGAENQQREYFLRKQMESIQRELGEDSASVVEEYRTKIAVNGERALKIAATSELRGRVAPRSADVLVGAARGRPGAVSPSLRRVGGARRRRGGR